MTSAKAMRQIWVGVITAAVVAGACSGGEISVAPTTPPAPVRRAAAPKTSATPPPVASVAPEAEPPEDLGPTIVAPHPAADLFASLPTGDEQLARLCKRGHRDRISKVFCADAPPEVTSLVELMQALGIAYVKPKLHVTENISGNGVQGNPAFVFMGHTTSLTARLVSPINPRAIVFTPPANKGISAYLTPDQFVSTPDFVAMAFTRGEQIVELVDRDPKTQDLRFFVVRFEQACNERKEGCESYELFTPAIERDWTRVTLYDDTDLENTPADCNVCHQPDGHGKKRVLLMQARRTPWTHFFRRNRDGGLENYKNYRLAHEEAEAYGGIPGSEIHFSDPAQLEGLVENEGFIKQPIVLHAEAIEREIVEKELTDKPELSLAWQLEYKRALKGEIPGVGFPTVGFFDSDRLRRAARAYRAVLAGRAKRDQFPYLGDMHRPEILFRVNLAPKPGVTGHKILLNTCRRCHNSRLNPKLSRARFDVDKLEKLPIAVLKRARERLVLPIDDPKRMPPARFGRLSVEEIERVTAVLSGVLEKRGHP